MKPSLVMWQDSYALGMLEIDDQHKMLFDIMNRLWDGIVRGDKPADQAVLLGELERYTVTHFLEEELFMRSIEYPRIEEHMRMHHHFVQKIIDEKKRVMQGEQVSLNLLHFLRDWLANHILVEDKRYVSQFHEEKRSTSLLGRMFASFR